ncbi:MAG TPA: GNAT family N-acetyltransferase [Acidimicrobiales bacterium]
MDWKVRLAEPGEVAQAVDLTAVVFGTGPVATPDYKAQVEAALEPDRTFVVTDGGAVVGTGGAFTYEMTLPGGTPVPLAAVTEVGVAPTHRRRGMLRAIMAALVDQALDRGEAAAGLTASEATIYRRFGYGVATRFHTLEVDPARTAELPELAGDRPAGAGPGHTRLVPPAEAAGLLPAIWERHWRRVPGELSRNPGWWRSANLDPEHERGGASARYVVVHEGADGAPDGYATYRLKQDWSPQGGGHDLTVEEVAGADDQVEAALVRFLLDVDLVRTVRWTAAPVDLPLRWRLADSRAVRVTAERDHLWLRPLDVARCLAGRRYAGAGGLVLGVVDPDRPDLGGRFRLDAGADGAAEVARTDAEPDLEVMVADLGAALLGGVSWATLRRVGLVDERRPGAVARADALFRTERAPFCATPF